MLSLILKGNLFGHYNRHNNVFKDIHSLILRTCEYVSLHDKVIFKGVITSMDFETVEIILDQLGEPN